MTLPSAYTAAFANCSDSSCLCYNIGMETIDKIENAWMLLPNRTVGFGTITISGDTITEIKKEEVPSLSILNSSFLILPGLVNCHCHAPMTLLRGVGGGLPLQRWLEEAIFPVEAKMAPSDIRAGALWGAMEMLAGGTTCVADMYEHPEETMSAFAEAGIRANLCKVGLASVPNRLADCISFASRTRQDAASPENGQTSQFIIDICVHSEYLADEAFCRALAEANREMGRPLHFHVSETKREHDECIARHGKTPIAYLAQTGLLDFGGYAAHCVWCTDDDFRIMAERGVSLVHNPSSNMKLGSGFARVPRAMELGVNVALGTDGTASNDNLDMFEEMHLASLIHKGVSRDPTVLSPWDVIEMATKNGAKALGRDDIGEIAVGKKADLCVVDMNRIHLVPAHDIPNLVVHSMHAGDVATTIVGGKVLYDRGSFPGLDAGKAKADLIASASRLGVVQ